MEPKDKQTQLDARSQHRAYVLDHVVAGSLTLDQAARVLGLSTRQVNRLIALHVAGPAALAHANRGRPPANRIDAALRPRLVELARTTYTGFNYAHLTELLAEREGIVAAERLPLPDASVDLVVSSLASHHWSEPATAIWELLRVLRPGARALIYDLRFAGFTNEELDTLAMVVGITRQTLRGGLLRLFAQVTLTAPGVPVVQ
jgi:SAM-dependent methyltransferase